MNISKIDNLYFGIKKVIKPHAEIEFINKLDGYAEYMLDSYNDKILHQADAHGRKFVKFAQRGNKLYINSGAITSSFDMEKYVGKDFLKPIISNIRANSEVERKGLVRGFEKLG